jgi:hypothetical protein
MLMKFPSFRVLWQHVVTFLLLRFDPFTAWFAKGSPWRVIYPLLCLIWWAILLLGLLWTGCSLFCGGYLAFMMLQALQEWMVRQFSLLPHVLEVGLNLAYPPLC